jgi:SAM-dependent methyltransferase
MLKRVVRFLKLCLLNITSRDDLSRRYLRGSGLEIGAMHFPLPVGPDVCVKYVDVNSRQENIAKHPEIDGAKVVETDFIEDGFKLTSFADNSVDFVIANHVLEHSCNPLGTLQVWSRVLKPRGILFVSVPNYLKCFDTGRKLALLEHIVKDYDEAQSEPESLRQRNREHYREWVEISLPNARTSNSAIQLPESHEKDAWIDNLLKTGEEIHFHTFSHALFRKMLNYYTSELDNGMKLIRIYNSSKHFEITAILQKLPIDQV